MPHGAGTGIRPGGHGRGPASDAMRAGLPFAGIPEELRFRVQKILDQEPEHERINIDFNPSELDERPFTLFRLINPHRYAFLFAFILVIFETAAMQIGPLLAKFGIDQGIMQKDLKVLMLVCLLYLGALLFNMLAGYARISWTGRLAERLMMSLRLRVFSHLQRLSMEFYTREMAGRIMTRMTSDIEALTSLLHDSLINFVVQGLALILVTTILFTLNVQLASFMLLFLLPLMLVLTLWFRKASESGYDTVRERIADVLTDLQENLTGIRIINAFNRQRRNISQHLNVLGLYRDANFNTVRAAATFDSGSNLISLLGQTVILFVGGHMLLKGTLSIGELTAFLLYLTSFFAPIQQLVQLYNTYQKGQAAVTKLRELLATRPQVLEKVSAMQLPQITGQVEFKNVSFSYEAHQQVIDDVNLTVEAGETLAFVGETGAGKTTIARLIARFYDPTTGEILIDGHPIRDVTLESLRRQIGYVPQEPFLFAGTIRDNIAFARPDASDEAVLEACRVVGIADLIDQMPNGIHTFVHERGATLSSGERQLLALARAFLVQPRIIVLDEATSNLDLASESKIQHALGILLKGRTALIIAHRLNTAMHADRIAVMKKGRIIEIGTHQQLLAQNGVYTQMHATWTKHMHSLPPPPVF